MGEQDIPQAVEVVEREDHNNANLGTFEVTWENGAVEQVQAHWVLHPTSSYGSFSCDDHIKFTGWYDGVHRTILSARPDRIRCIRDLGVLSSLPDVDPDEPGQVEPEPAGIRVCDLSLNMKVTHPDVHDGRPIRIVDVGVSEDFDGHHKVMYEDPTLIGPVMVRHLPADTLVTPYGGAE